MLQVDQAIRSHIDYSDLPDTKLKESEQPKLFQDIAVVDRANEARLKKMLDSCGWPKVSVYGKAASGAAWLLLQHATPPTQERYLPLLGAAVEQHEAPLSDFAYLSDRVAVHQGRPQLYGTQMKQGGACSFELQPIDDRKRVNERRKLADMPSLEDYEAMFRSFTESHGCPAASQ